MSFNLTTPQMRLRTKFVTRRLGWWNVKRGELLSAIEKGQGLKKGEKVVRIATIRVLSACGERLRKITVIDVTLEGFPELSTAEFIAMFCAHNRCLPSITVNRIAFEFL